MAPTALVVPRQFQDNLSDAEALDMTELLTGPFRIHTTEPLLPDPAVFGQGYSTIVLGRRPQLRKEKMGQPSKMAAPYDGSK